MTLAELLDDPTVDEIRLHGVAAAEITRAGCVERIAAPLENVDDLEDLIASLLDDAELDELGPVVIDTVLSDGRALTVVPVPLAPAGPLVRIQRRVSPSLTFDDLIERGAMTQEQLDALGAAVNRRDNVLVVGPNAIHRHGFCEALLGLLDERSGVISYGGPHRMKAQAGVVELDRTALGEAGEGLSDTARALGASMVITDTLSRDDLAEWVSIALDGQCGLIGAIAGRTGDSALARAALALDLAFGGSLGGQSSAMMTASVDIMVCLGEDSGGPTVTECGAP
jgi:hypothetical protein